MCGKSLCRRARHRRCNVGAAGRTDSSVRAQAGQGPLPLPLPAAGEVRRPRPRGLEQGGRAAVQGAGGRLGASPGALHRHLLVGRHRGAPASVKDGRAAQREEDQRPRVRGAWGWLRAWTQPPVGPSSQALVLSTAFTSPLEASRPLGPAWLLSPSRARLWVSGALP